MDLKTLEALGLRPADLEQRIIDKAVEELLTGVSFDEGGEEWRSKSSLARRIDERIKQHIDETVNALADTHILPNVSAYIEKLVLQETNKWGEKTGRRITFIEYLTQRAETYMTERVNYNGKTQNEESYSWSANSTRVAYMIDKHLYHSIETAMKQALQTANSSIANGIQETVKMKLAEIVASLQTTVKVGR